MAAMDIRKARALAEQMIKSGQNKGLDLEDLVQQIVAESAGAGAPGTAIGAAMMPRVELTPAQTAPGQPGVQLVAPKPVAEAPQRPASRPSRYQPELDRVLANLGAAKKAMSDAVASGQKPNVTDQIRLDAMQETADRLGALVRAEGGPDAEIPEEMRAAFEGRQARLARREELLAEAKARSPWEALIAGGAALAQGRRGERFTEALSRGLQTGIQEYGRARRAGEEGAESIAEARDQALMDRYNMREQAVANARQRALEMMGIGEKAEERAIREVRLPTQLATEAAQADLAKFKAESAPRELEAELGLKGAQATYYRNRPTTGADPDKPMTENQRQTKIQQLMLKRNDYAVKFAQAKMFGGAGSAELAAAIKAIDERLLALKTGGGTPATAGTPAPSFVYSPGRGLQPVR